MYSVFVSKLTEDQIRIIYRKSWLDCSTAELAEKYNVSMSTILAIKNGRTWSSVTGHVEGTVPDFIIKWKQPRIISEEERKARRDTWTT